MEDRKAKQIVQRVVDSSLSGIRDDPWMARRVLNIAHELEKRPGRKRCVSRLAVMALLFVLAFAATAFAFTRPAVLSWLSGNAPVSPQLESTAQTVIGENTAGSMTIRVTGVGYDGDKLAFAYELENDQPAMPVLVAADPIMSVDGQTVQMRYCTADPGAPQMVPSPHLDVLPVRRNPAVGGGEVYVGDLPAERVSCEITFVVYQPEKQFAVVLPPDSMQANAESMTGDARAEARDSLDTLKGFRNAVFAAEAELAGDHGYTVIDGSGTLYDLPEKSHLTEISRIRVRFAFDASVALACDFVRPGDVVLADAVLHVERFRLSSLETRVDLWLIPQENTEKAARDLAQRYGAYTLTDEQGRAVQYSEMDYMASDMPYATQIDGRWVCRYLSEMPGLLCFPERVGFVAGNEELICFELNMEE